MPIIVTQNCCISYLSLKSSFERWVGLILFLIALSAFMVIMLVMPQKNSCIVAQNDLASSKAQSASLHERSGALQKLARDFLLERNTLEKLQKNLFSLERFFEYFVLTCQKTAVECTAFKPFQQRDTTSSLAVVCELECTCRGDFAGLYALCSNLQERCMGLQFIVAEFKAVDAAVELYLYLSLPLLKSEQV